MQFEQPKDQQIVQVKQKSSLNPPSFVTAWDFQEPTPGPFKTKNLLSDLA